MAFVIGLFEDVLHARAAIDGLRDAGFTGDKISVLSKEYLTKQDSVDIYNRRTSDLGAIVGSLAGVHTGAAIGFGLAVLPGVGPVVASGILGAVLATAAGGAIGAAIGGFTGMKLVPSLMESLGVSEKDAHFFAEAVKRDGTLIAVETTAANQSQAEQIMKESNAVDIKERREQYEFEGWRGYEEEDEGPVDSGPSMESVRYDPQI
ncbi:MAG TPA: hypothetical protein PKE64_15765 [Anaerolineae bacterium]|nr:hypothetical protein [Anaerolineae bacterium]HMR65463.1 hypothetical protein [Anaerolineae bacterium]